MEVRLWTLLVEVVYLIRFDTFNFIVPIFGITQCLTPDSVIEWVATGLAPMGAFSGFIDGEITRGRSEFVRETFTTKDHGIFRTLFVFEEVTIGGRTGAAVLEAKGSFEAVEGGLPNDSELTLLCGTGDLKNAHGVVITTAPSDGVNGGAYSFWIHFGHSHDLGFEFLCDDLDNTDNGDDDSGTDAGQEALERFCKAYGDGVGVNRGEEGLYPSISSDSETPVEE